MAKESKPAVLLCDAGRREENGRKEWINASGFVWRFDSRHSVGSVNDVVMNGEQ